MSQSRIVGQHGHHHAAVPRRFPDGFGYAGPEAGDLGQLLRSAIVDNQIMVSFEQAPSHCLAHATKTYESNFHDHPRSSITSDRRVTVINYNRAAKGPKKDPESVRLGKKCVSTCRSRWSPYH